MLKFKAYLSDQYCLILTTRTKVRTLQGNTWQVQTYRFYYLTSTAEVTHWPLQVMPLSLQLLWHRQQVLGINGAFFFEDDALVYIRKKF